MSKISRSCCSFPKSCRSFGDLNAVVNNAGKSPYTPLTQLQRNNSARTFAINVGGVIWGDKRSRLNLKHLVTVVKSSMLLSSRLSEPNLTGSYGGSQNSLFVVLLKHWRGDFSRVMRNYVNAYAPGIVKNTNDVWISLGMKLEKNGRKMTSGVCKHSQKDIGDWKRPPEPQKM